MGLEKSYLFSRLTPDELSLLKSVTKEKSYRARSILFYAGEMPKTLHIVQEGRVKIYKHDEKGNEIHLAYFNPDDMIAEMAHFEGIPYPATARCESDVRVYEIDFEAFRAQVLSNPGLSFQIIRSLTRKIKQLETLIQGSLVDDAPTRLARFLVENHTKLDSFTQRKISEILMLAPETVSRALRHFKTDGWVEVRQKKLAILDLNALKTFLQSKN